MSGTDHAYVSPSTSCPDFLPVGFDGVSALLSIIMSETMVPRYESELNRKQKPIDTVAMMIPASDGPTARAVLFSVALRLIAFFKCASSTISETNDCRAGLSNTRITPKRNAYKYNIHNSIAPARRIMLITNERAPNAVCVVRSIIRLSSLSAMTPPHGPKKNIGPNWNARTKPSMEPDPESASTSQPSA